MLNLRAPLGMLIDLLWQDKQKVCVPVHLGKIKSTVLTACLLSVCVDSLNFQVSDALSTALADEKYSKF